jgi:hypothetical protein
MKQLELDDRTFERAELQARALRLTLAEYVRNLVEHEKPVRAPAKNPIGLFADRPEIIDEMMIDVAHTRGQIFRTPLAGIPVEYIDPFEPAVPPEEWNL